MEANDLSSLVSAVTSNPEMMRRVMGALSSLSAGSGEQQAPPENEHRPEKQDSTLPVGISDQKPDEHNRAALDRKRLLVALKPYLGKERRGKAEMLINVLSLLDSGLFDMLGKGE